MECPADPPKEQSAFLLFIAYPQKHASFSKHFVPFFYCLPQQLWCFYFSLLSLSFQESFQQLVSTVSQGPLLYHGRVESCITGEGSHFHQFSLSRLYVLSLLDSAPSGSIRDREGIKSKELDTLKQKLTAQKLSGLKIPFNKKFQKW